jgi:hypothetical protein
MLGFDVLALGLETFKEDTFMGGMLIDKIETVWPFGNQVGGTNLPHEEEKWPFRTRKSRLLSGLGRRL